MDYGVIGLLAVLALWDMVVAVERWLFYKRVDHRSCALETYEIALRVTGPGVEHPYQTGKNSDHDTERREERFSRLVRMLHEHPTCLSTNPTCSRRVLYTAQLAPIPLKCTDQN